MINQTIWLNNIKESKKKKKLNLNTYQYNLDHYNNKYPNLYKKYDNYDAIEVSNCNLLPLDDTEKNYYGISITGLQKDLSDFKIVDLIASRLNSQKLFKRVIIKKQQ